MIKKSGIQYCVLKKHVPEIYSEMIKVGKKVEPIMVNMLVKRFVCKKDKNDNEWVRVLEGDIESIGSVQRCTMTLISEENNDKNNQSVTIETSEDAVNFVHEIGYKVKFYQENLRSKFKFIFSGDTYIIRFDVWAQIPDLAIIEIDLLLGKKKEPNYSAIAKKIKIRDYAVVINNVKGKFINIENLFHECTEENVKTCDITDRTIDIGLWKDDMKNIVRIKSIKEFIKQS